MATGGTALEDDSNICDLFECAICFESLLEKEPRLLHCGHTFCTPCLRQLEAEKCSLFCPKCRGQTILPATGIESLSLNRDLRKMKDIQIQLIFQSKIQCQMCQSQSAEAEYKCNTCMKNLCQICNGTHKRVPALRQHEIVQLGKTRKKETKHEICQKHDEPLDMVCLPCEETICISCISDQKHAKHQEDILDYKSGLPELKKAEKAILVTLKEAVQNVAVKAETIQEKKDEIKAEKDSLFAQQENLKEKLQKLTDELENVIKLEENISSLHQDITKHGKDLQEHANYLDFLTKTNGEDCKMYSKNRKQRTEQLLRLTNFFLINNVKELLIKITEDPTEDKLDESIETTKIRKQIPLDSEFDIRKADFKTSFVPFKELSLKNPTLEKNITSGDAVELNDPCELISIGDGTVILVNLGLSYVQRIDTKGKLERKYEIDDEQSVVSADVYNGYLYIASSEQMIIEMPLDDHGVSDVFQVKAIESASISVTALDEENVIITEKYTDKIWQHNTKTNLTTQIPVQPLAKPTKVYIARCGSELRYLITYQDKLTGIKKVDICDKDWKLVSTIENLQHLEGLEITPGGTLFLADSGSNNILQYTLDGTFAGKLFGANGDTQLCNVCDVAYQPPHLWVIQKNPNNLKIFKVY